MILIERGEAYGDRLPGLGEGHALHDGQHDEAEAHDARHREDRAQGQGDEVSEGPSAKIWEQVSNDRGTTYRSIPAAVPEHWTMGSQYDASNMKPLLLHVSGEYVIRRRPYGAGSWSYTVLRQGVVIGELYGRLKDAKARAEQNARGEDTIHFAERHVKR
jgi:hypothetical protein